MPKLAIHFVDSFTSEPFKGNPAVVIPLEQWLPLSLMQAIATENNQSETAFYVALPDGKIHIRWFSPIKEIPFCGHATLATAGILLERSDPGTKLVFFAPAVGNIPAVLCSDGMIEMSFPIMEPDEVTAVPQAIIEGLSRPPTQLLRNTQAYIAVYESEAQVRAIVPNLSKLVELGPFDVAVTAPGTRCDFVSRYFWPANGGAEDPVTGSIHAGLAPYWSKRLGKSELSAIQVSARSGNLACRVGADRVFVAGHVVRYLEGTINV